MSLGVPDVQARMYDVASPTVVTTDAWMVWMSRRGRVSDTTVVEASWARVVPAMAARRARGYIILVGVVLVPG